jgi:hypothetical protein
MIPRSIQTRVIIPENGKSPLVLPDNTPEPQSDESLPVLDLRATEDGSTRVPDKTPDPLIQGLVDRLPKPDSVWSLKDRVKWLRTAANIFVLIYKSREGEDKEVKLVLAKDETI